MNLDGLGEWLAFSLALRSGMLFRFISRVRVVPSPFRVLREVAF